MFIGGCAGSTSGGIKVIRATLLAKIMGQELQPSAAAARGHGAAHARAGLQRGGPPRGPLLHGHLRARRRRGYVRDADLWPGPDERGHQRSSCLALLGAGLGDVGPTQGFSSVPEGGRSILMFPMLAGRLEVLTVLARLTPAFWRRNVA